MKKLSIDNQKGFGLLTVFVTILMASSFLTFFITTQKEQLSVHQLLQTEAKVEILRQAIINYKLNHINLTYVSTVGAPAVLSNLVNDTGDPCVGDNVPANPSYLTLQGWCGPYLDQKVSENLSDYQIDGWGNAFVYDSSTEVITSFGPDGINNSGGGDDLVFAP